MNGVLHWFTRAALTENHKLHGFNRGSLLSLFWRLEVEIRILSLKVLGKNQFQVFLLGAHSSLSLPVTFSLPASESMSKFSLSIRTKSYVISAHPDGLILT